MSDEALKHKDHYLNWNQKNFASGNFLYAYCVYCKQELGTLNITVILSKMELEE